MQAIISLKKPDGTYHEIGMKYRKLVKSSSIAGIHKAAKKFADDKPYRAEFFSNDDIYEPFQVDYIDEGLYRVVESPPEYHIGYGLNDRELIVAATSLHKERAEQIARLLNQDEQKQ